MSRNTKILILSISTAVLLVALGFLLGHNPCSDIDNFVKGEVMKQLDERDSILTKQVQKYADTCTVNINVELYQLDSCTETKIKYLVSEASRENLGQYINEENNHMTWLAIIIAALVSIVGIGIPVINSDMKRQIDDIKKVVEDASKKAEKAKDKAEEAKDKAEAAKQDAEIFNEKAKESEKAAKASELFAKALAEKDLDKQIELFSEVLKLDSMNADALNNRGIAYKQKGDYNLAIKGYNEAIRLNPNYAEAYNNRGTAYSDKGNYDQAIKDYNQAIMLKPMYAAAYGNRGIAYSYNNDMKPAIEDFKKAVELQHNDMNNINLEMAHIMQLTKNFKESDAVETARSKAQEGLKKAEEAKDKDWVKYYQKEWKEIFQKFLDELPPEE
jgi:tetratricopeptide (TPR) repeat protein